MLMKAADILEAREDQLRAAMTAETGCTNAWVASNIRLGAAMLREAGAMTTQINGEVIPTDQPHNLSLAVRQPVGVVLGIAPWNAPVVLSIRAVAMALACGNTAILKSSELCPATHWLVADVLRQAGLPPGACNLISHSPVDAGRLAESLIAHPAVRRVNFTGSTHVGRLVAQMCATHLKPALLELGGKAPLVVLDDADLDEAVKAAAFGAFMNQGQICMSTERIVVDRKVADEFVERLAAKARTLVHTHSDRSDAVFGALVDEASARRVKALVDDAVSRGARVVAGGRVKGAFMDATVVDHVVSDMPIYAQETFGPVVAVVRVNGVDEAVRVANDTEYGLVSAVFGRDIGRALGVARLLDSGICHINSGTLHNEPQMPFGGMKASGYGRFGGRSVIDQFTELRWISVQTAPRAYPF